MREKIAKAIHQAIQSNPRKLKGEAIALQMNIATSTLYKWGDIGGIPLERLMQFVLITNDLRPIFVLCEIMGGMYIPDPDKAHEKNNDMHNANVVKEVSDTLQAAAIASMDGKVSKAEAEKIKREGLEAMTAIASFVKHYCDKVEE